MYHNNLYMILPVEKFFHDESNTTEKDYNSFTRIKYLQVIVLHKLDTFEEEGISNMVFLRYLLELPVRIWNYIKFYTYFPKGT